MLWTLLRCGQLLGYKFRRQQGIGPYIVDFYCPAKKVAVEIDGETHWTDKEQIYDQDRQQAIETIGIRVLRFSNDDVYKNCDGVLNTILMALEGNEGE